MATGPEIEITVDNRTKLSMIIANDHNDYFNIKYSDESYRITEISRRHSTVYDHGVEFYELEACLEYWYLSIKYDKTITFDNFDIDILYNELEFVKFNFKWTDDWLSSIKVFLNDYDTMINLH